MVTRVPLGSLFSFFLVVRPRPLPFVAAAAAAVVVDVEVVEVGVVRQGWTSYRP